MVGLQWQHWYNDSVACQESVQDDKILFVFFSFSDHRAWQAAWMLVLQFCRVGACNLQCNGVSAIVMQAGNEYKTVERLCELPTRVCADAQWLQTAPGSREDLRSVIMVVSGSSAQRGVQLYVHSLKNKALIAHKNFFFEVKIPHMRVGWTQ